jgi:hypothetical protein
VDLVALLSIDAVIVGVWYLIASFVTGLLASRWTE